jgi:hypothetical protein
MAELHNDRPVVGVRILGDGSGGSDPTGAVDDAAYSDDTGAANGSVIALLKGIIVQNAAIIALLTSIDEKTPEA